MNEVCVRIPHDEYYTLFAEGVFQSKEKNEDSSYLIHLNADFTFFLYYTFRFHRRLYICNNSFGKKLINIDNVSEPVNIVCELRGRAFDNFKRSVDYLNIVTKGEFYRLPPIYFWQIALLCRLNKNSKINLILLTKKYAPSIIIREIEWNNLR